MGTETKYACMGGNLSGYPPTGVFWKKEQMNRRGRCDIGWIYGAGTGGTEGRRRVWIYAIERCGVGGATYVLSSLEFLQLISS
jgi:hypothetical protein